MLRFFVLWMILGVAVGTVGAEDLCGIIDAPTTLTKAKSPYRLLGDLYVSPAARLTMEAGVVLVVVPGEACGDTRQIDWADSNMISIKVDGAFFITGTPDEPVQILPEKHKPGKIQWDGIRIRNKRPILVQIENLHIAGAQKALNITYSSFHVANSIFADNNTAIWLENEAGISVYNNLFTGNRSAAIVIRESIPSIVANIFYQNVNYAIDSDSRPKPRIEHNLFYKNGDSHCWHCPIGVGMLSRVNERGDSTDKNFNLFKDPVFFGSSADLYLAARDPANPTSTKLVKDTALLRMHATAESQGRSGLKPAGRYTPNGNGPWRLSRYSPALDAAPDNDFFKDANGTRGDIGVFGGKLGRARAKK